MEKHYDILSRINENFPTMSKSHKAIARFIKEDYDQAVQALKDAEKGCADLTTGYDSVEQALKAQGDAMAQYDAEKAAYEKKIKER